MENYKKKLSSKELNDFLTELDNNNGMNDMSADSDTRIVLGQDGTEYVVNSKNAKVLLDQNSMPNVVNERRNQVLSCGHVVSSDSDILGQCKYNHLVCNKHEIYNCVECRAPLCHLDVEFNEEGQPICPDHDDFDWMVGVAILVLVGGIIMAIMR